MKKTLCIMGIVGARPNFMKIAPIIRVARKDKRFIIKLVHTGQHYSPELSNQFFQDLNIPQPDIHLGIGSGSRTEQVSKTLFELSGVLSKLQPDVVLLVGDVNATLAGALAASFHNIPCVHVEAGLRSYNRNMPEEINRIITDQLSDAHFTTEASAAKNLKHEGIQTKQVHFVGNVMIDTLLQNKKRAVQTSTILDQLSLAQRRYGVLTLHRPSNVDNKSHLQDIITNIGRLPQKYPIVFPIHPRTQQNIKRFRLHSFLQKQSNIVCLKPLGYLDFLSLMVQSYFVLTDSGGIQEETTALGIPCFTLRAETERPITIREGTNTIIGNKYSLLRKRIENLERNKRKARIPKYWDGRASERILDHLYTMFHPS